MRRILSQFLAIVISISIATPSYAGWVTRRFVGGAKTVVIIQGSKAVIPYAARTGVRAISKLPSHISKKLTRAANDNHVALPLSKRIFDNKTADHLIKQGEAGKLVRSANKRNPNFRERLIKAKGPPPGPKMDADHIQPLSLGGKDNAMKNGAWKDERPNRSEGGGYSAIFKKNPVPFGTRYKAHKVD